MGQFKTGDKVTVIDGGTDNAGTEGKHGTVVDGGELSGGEIAVKGIDSRTREAVLGYRGYTANQLKHR